MIVRIIAIDPNPDPKRASDLLVFQVPEHSREFAVLTESFTKAGIEWDTIFSVRKPKETNNAIK